MSAPIASFWASGKARPEGAIGVFAPTRIEFKAPADTPQEQLNEMALKTFRDGGFEPLYAIGYPFGMGAA